MYYKKIGMPVGGDIAKNIRQAFGPKSPPVRPPTMQEIEADRLAWDNACPPIPPDYFCVVDNKKIVKINTDEAKDKAVILVHGGGFTAGSARTHFGLGQKIVKASGLDVYIIEYPLAPEAKLDKQVASLTDTVQSLTKHYKKLVLCGDSAGCAIIFHYLKAGVRSEIELVVMISPWLDLNLSAYERTRDDFDPLVSLAALKNCAHLVGFTDELDFEVKNLPPTVIVCGELEILTKDAHAFCKQNQARNIALYEFEGCWHVFPAWDIPQSQDALSLAFASLN